MLQVFVTSINSNKGLWMCVDGGKKKKRLPEVIKDAQNESAIFGYLVFYHKISFTDTVKRHKYFLCLIRQEHALNNIWPLIPPKDKGAFSILVLHNLCVSNIICARVDCQCSCNDISFKICLRNTLNKNRYTFRSYPNAGVLSQLPAHVFKAIKVFMEI